MNRFKSWPYPDVVAHRGAGKLAPENTLAAIRKGAEYGHKMVEFDVTLSADNVAFLLHDDTLNRTTLSDGVAAEMNWETLATLDAGNWFSDEYKNEPLPQLSEVAALTKMLDLSVNIEIKPAVGIEYHTGELIAQLAHNLFNEHTLLPLLSSFSFEALKAAKARAPDLPRGYLMHTWQEDWLEKVKALECVALHLNHELITQARIDEIKSQGLFIFVYTVNDIDRAKLLLTMGVDAICTDNVSVIKPTL